MGITVKLWVLPNTIRDDEMAPVDAQVARLWKEHPSRPIRAVTRDVLGVRLGMYTAQIEREDGGRHIAISGDRASLRFSERFELYEKGSPTVPSEPARDIAVGFARSHPNAV